MSNYRQASDAMYQAMPERDQCTQELLNLVRKHQQGFYPSKRDWINAEQALINAGYKSIGLTEEEED